jgi:hypothetical protein
MREINISISLPIALQYTTLVRWECFHDIVDCHAPPQLYESLYVPLSYSLRDDSFDLVILMSGIKQAYGLNVQDEGHRTIQSIFLSVAVKHSLALSAGPKGPPLTTCWGRVIGLAASTTLP